MSNCETSKDEFETSPFNDEIVCLRFADNGILTVHYAMIKGYRKLNELVSKERCRYSSGSGYHYNGGGSYNTKATVDLSKFSTRAGHALVEYLYTSRYLPLQRKANSTSSSADSSCTTAARDLQDFKMRLEIYALARTVQLAGLEWHAKGDIERLGSQLGVFPVLDAVKEVYPKPVGNDTWFAGWVRTIAKQALAVDPDQGQGSTKQQPLTRLFGNSAGSETHDLGNDAAVAKFLFGCMAEVYSEAMARIVKLHSDRETCVADGVSSTAGEQEPPTPMSGSSFDDVSQTPRASSPAPVALDLGALRTTDSAASEGFFSFGNSVDKLHSGKTPGVKKKKKKIKATALFEPEPAEPVPEPVTNYD